MAAEMIERLARILEPQAWAALGTGGDTLAYQNRRTSSLRKARLSIEAMREPLNDMVIAGMQAGGEFNRQFVEGLSDEPRAFAASLVAAGDGRLYREAYRAMIDEALR
ncbi:hypothetical protein [Bradyrhizobium prioriisuperbiae]|uniref:hypothetical protein n=1 Tax=Bradyrhizobium prioriisuperbiae TaxID=2854389 RepID=UPI0028E7F68D|nr:hypothetical protein [Bradyrhizobium prioritasuperba]